MSFTPRPRQIGPPMPLEHMYIRLTQANSPSKALHDADQQRLLPLNNIASNPLQNIVLDAPPERLISSGVTSSQLIGRIDTVFARSQKPSQFAIHWKA
jgi:hypothetical protein